MDQQKRNERACESLQAADKQKLEEARYQAEQAFQRGGLDREQAFAAYGLDESGYWLSKKPHDK